MMIKDRDGKERYFCSEGLHRLLMRIKQKINEEDSEFWMCYFGKTGEGKSLASQKDAYVIDPTINTKRICFSQEEFITAVLSAKKGQVIIADEAISIFFSRGSMTKGGRLVAEISNQIRQKNLCIMLCVPSIISIDFLILEKLSCAVYVWETRQKEGSKVKTMKGNRAYYLEMPKKPQKSLLVQYLKSKRINPLKAKKKPKPFIYMPGNYITSEVWYPAGEKEYRQKKEAVLAKYQKPLEQKMPISERDIKAKIIYEMKTNNKLTLTKISSLLGIPRTTCTDYYRRYEDIERRRDTNILNNSGDKGENDKKIN